MTATVVLTAVTGLVLLTAGAELLVRGASAVALQLGLSALAVGLTVVAFGTSAPEFVVSLQAATRGSAAIAVGNVVGSNICNIALILGLAALVRPTVVQARLYRLDVPLLVVLSLLAALLLAGPGIGRVAGAALLAGLGLYTALTLRQARTESRDVRQEFAQALDRRRLPLVGAVVMLAAGLVLLAVGAELLVRAAVRIAALAGMSEAAIGLTVVAVGTSLPELAASVVAAARGQGDIAVGNVVGSNLFNLLGVLGASAVATPLIVSGMTWRDLLVMLALAVALLPISRSGFVVSRREGALLVLCYVAYLIWLLAFDAGIAPTF